MARCFHAVSDGFFLTCPDMRVEMVEGDEFIQLNGFGHVVAVQRDGHILGWSPTYEFIPNTEGK